MHGWNRDKVSENIGATAVIPVAPGFGTFDSFLAGLVWAEIKCTVHIGLTSLNQFSKAENNH